MSNDTALAEYLFLLRARFVILAVPVVLAIITTFVGGVPVGILVLASGTLLCAVLFIWSSLRTLSGDAQLLPSAELEDAAPPEASLFAQKNRLLRAIRDLENEHALGRLTEEDFETSREQYRAELRQVLESSDALLAPHREAAELLVEEYRRQKANSAYRSAPPKPPLECPKCKVSNEGDARFCKSCAFELGGNA